MNAQEAKSLLTDLSTQAIRERFEKDLDRESPAIGSRGPTAPGPEEPYLRALVTSDEAVKRKAGQAIDQILLKEALGTDEIDAVPRPLLLFNLLSLLEGVRMPMVLAGLQALRAKRAVLSGALADRNEDLYRQLLLAFAENQPHGTEKDFWRNLLQEDDAKYADAAVKGLRGAGWMAGCETLHEVKDVYDSHPELGDFGRVVELLMDEHPEANWPDCAKAYYDDWQHQEIWQLIQQHAPERYEEPLSIIPRSPRSALDDLLTRLDAKAVDRIGQENRQRAVVPSRAMMGA